MTFNAYGFGTAAIAHADRVERAIVEIAVARDLRHDEARTLVLDACRTAIDLDVALDRLRTRPTR